MKRSGRLAALALTALVAVGAFASEVGASAFVAWKVADISAADVLMVRAYPNATSRILVGYPDGVMLSMTGKCTGGLRLDEIQTLPRSQQRELARARWCEVWLDPYGTGEFRAGWVFGRYIKPA